MVRRLLFFVLLAACDRNETKANAVDASASPSSSPSSSVIAPSYIPMPTDSAVLPPSSGPPVAPIEARRAKAMRVEDDPALVAAVDPLKKHFGGQVPREMALQIAERPEGRGRVLLVTDATKPPPGDPFSILVDGSGALKWTKDHPAAGIQAPIGPLAIAAGPSGRVALAICDPPTARVALRLTEDDGLPFADYDAMDMDDCTAISLLYWPRRGFVIVATRAGTTKAQLVTEAGALAWRRGIEIGARSVTGAPASIAADSDDSFVLVQYGAAADARPGARAHALAFRFDRQGAPLWGSPVDLGVAPVDRVDDRIALARPKPGVIRASLAKGQDVDVTSNGTVSSGNTRR